MFALKLSGLVALTNLVGLVVFQRARAPRKRTLRAADM